MKTIKKLIELMQNFSSLNPQDENLKKMILK